MHLTPSWVHVRFTDPYGLFATDSDEHYDSLCDMGSTCICTGQLGDMGREVHGCAPTPAARRWRELGGGRGRAKKGQRRWAWARRWQERETVQERLGQSGDSEIPRTEQWRGSELTKTRARARVRARARERTDKVDVSSRRRKLEARDSRPDNAMSNCHP